MIINCPSCNKRFNVKDEYIPKIGRSLKCGSCGEEWFFREISKSNQIKNKDEINVSNEHHSEIKKKQNKSIENDSIDPIKKDKKEFYIKDKVERKETNFLRKLLVILISFIAVILVFDTYKVQISVFLPGIIPLLDNLYLVLDDMLLFMRDIIR